MLNTILYGTAWKKEKTSELVVKAVKAGFRGIDTAGQPKHYNEKAVGDAVKTAESFEVFREDLFIQTKFTSITGQDPTRIPYDPSSPLSAQVADSFASSLRNLGTNYVDSYILHSPLPQWKQTEEVWSAMEEVHQQGGAKILGISNCYDLEIMARLYEWAKVKPRVLQNRFYAETFYDSELRAWCKTHDVQYQSFWTLTANPYILRSPLTQELCQVYQRTAAQIFFRFVTQIGITPLTGTSSEIHMREDLDIFSFELSNKDIEKMEAQLKFDF